MTENVRKFADLLTEANEIITKILNEEPLVFQQQFDEFTLKSRRKRDRDWALFVKFADTETWNEICTVHLQDRCKIASVLAEFTENYLNARKKMSEAVDAGILALNSFRRDYAIFNGSV